MSHSPLGARYHRQKAGQRRVLLHPAAGSYLISVRLPALIVDDLRRRQEEPSSSAPAGRKSVELLPMADASSDEFAGCAANVSVVRLPADATASDAIDTILDSVSFGGLPSGAFMLVQCFADFSVNFALRAMFGTGAAIKLCMEFPYNLALVVSPYYQQQQALVTEGEPRKRSELVNEQRLFHQFAVEYFGILERLRSHYDFLLSREADARRTRKQQERRDFFDISEVLLFRGERLIRRAHEDAESAIRSILFLAAMGVMEHLQLQAKLLEEYAAITAQERATLARAQRSYQWICILQSRFQGLVETLVELFENGKQYRRALYTDSRIQATLRGARETALQPDAFHNLRIRVGHQRLAHRYGSIADIAQPDILIDDIMSNSRALV